MASTSSGDAAACGGGGEVAVTVKMAAPAVEQKSVIVMKKRERGGSTAKERISKMPPSTAGKRSSIYRGVTRHRWTGRYEAHLWDKSTWNQNQNKKGKQVYLGAYDDEEAAARAYDLAALKYWGPGTLINFPVSDYSRDLQEMQNVSREEYLASLRRKSSGFSRGIAKYRALSSGRWEPSLGRAGAEYLNSVHYGKGDDVPAENEYTGGFSTERKIDLTSHIKWWGANKTRQSDVKHSSAEEAGIELKSLERETQSTKPYQIPQLGTSYEARRNNTSATSALSILTKSAAFKNLQERASKAKETVNDSDEKENKSMVNKIDCGKAVQKASDDTGVERMGSALGIGGLPLHKNAFPLSPLLTAPLLTNYNAVDPLGDPILWTSLMPVLPTAPSRTAEVTKTEASSTYSFFSQEEG